MVSLIVQLVLASTLLVIGYWGRRNHAELVPADLPEDDRARRGRILNRGARTCQVIGCLFAVLTVVGWFF